MVARFDVRGDVREVERMLDRLEKRTGPSVLVRTINDTAKHARTHSTRQTAKSLKLPLANVRNRFNQYGQKKGERTWIRKANRVEKTAILNVYGRGIPVFQIAGKAPPVGKQRKGGVKAKGGRQYKNAFYAPKSGRMIVLARLRRGRFPTGMPKVGVRKRLDWYYNRYTKGYEGRKYFRKRYLQLIRFALEKENNSGRGRG